MFDVLMFHCIWKIYLFLFELQFNLFSFVLDRISFGSDKVLILYEFFSCPLELLFKVRMWRTWFTRISAHSNSKTSSICSSSSSRSSLNAYYNRHIATCDIAFSTNMYSRGKMKWPLCIVNCQASAALSSNIVIFNA